MSVHRVTCVDCIEDGSSKIWRENCEECATERAEKHRAETGHEVHLAITTNTGSMWELREMTRRAHMVLISPKRKGW